MKLWFGSETI